VRDPLYKGDAQDPKWAETTRVHDWRNYISEEVRAMWSTFTPEQQEALACQADSIADAEEWD
jgi:hypothetical protein